MENNDFLKSLGLPSDPKEIIGKSFSFHATEVDLDRCWFKSIKFTIFGNITGISLANDKYLTLSISNNGSILDHIDGISYFALGIIMSGNCARLQYMEKHHNSRILLDIGNFILL